MNGDANMMQRLLWKDTRTIQPLVIAIVIGVVVLNFAFLLLTVWLGESDRDVFIGLWILMPNLVALGAPALLVGSEEESGTLGWLRTLPMRWQRIADSKFIVSLASVVIAWIVASLLLVVVLAATSNRITPFSDDLLSVSGVLQLGFFSLLLLLCGFITAYSIRSPVTGLIVLVPLIAVANTIAIEIGRWILSGYWRFGGSTHNAGAARWFAVIAVAVVTLVALWLLQRLVARRRLASPAGMALPFPSAATTQAYRPPARVGMGRPSKVAALLWQQSRQVGTLSVALTVVVAAFVILFRFVDSTPSRLSSSLEVLSGFAPLVIGLGASWLGVLAFYGDNVRRRCNFFADRGISPTAIWITRLLIPLLLCTALVLLQFALIIGASTTRVLDQSSMMAILIAMTFVFGQLVAQWMPRATLTFLAAPTYALISCVGLFLLFSFYPTYYLTAWLMVPVLLFATWRLAGRWLTGQIGAGFHARVAAYTMLGLLLACLAVFGHRYWTTPAEMTPWRAEMLAAEVDSDGGLAAHEISPDAYGFGGSFVRDLDLDSIRDLMQQELASNGMIADFVSQSDLEDVLNIPGIGNEMRHDAIAIKLKWASVIRTEAAAGLHNLYSLDVAEIAELRAIEELELRIGHNDPQWSELVAMIPSDELRRRSRRTALIREWQTLQRSSWEFELPDGDVMYRKSFAGQPLANGVTGLSLERRRADRYIDAATRLTLQQLDGKLPVLNSPEYLRRQQLWNETLGPWQVWYGVIWIAGYHWTSDYQQRIDRLRTHSATR